MTDSDVQIDVFELARRVIKAWDATLTPSGDPFMDEAQAMIAVRAVLDAMGVSDDRQ